MTWQNTPTHIDDYFGFVYLITNVKTGRKYIGKKFFFETKKLQPLKGRTKKDKEKRVGLKNKRHIKKESDWKNYWGSSKELLLDIESLGEKHFKREILSCYKTKWECAYYEIKAQIDNKVLFSDDYYNGIINVRIAKSPKHLRK